MERTASQGDWNREKDKESGGQDLDGEEIETWWSREELQNRKSEPKGSDKDARRNMVFVRKNSIKGGENPKRAKNLSIEVYDLRRRRTTCQEYRAHTACRRCLKMFFVCHPVAPLCAPLGTFHPQEPCQCPAKIKQSKEIVGDTHRHASRTIQKARTWRWDSPSPVQNSIGEKKSECKFDNC